jgi:hypothetical protein
MLDPPVSSVASQRATFARVTDQAGGAPAFVDAAFARYLCCGILSQGFARYGCTTCGHDHLVPLSDRATRREGSGGGKCVCTAYPLRARTRDVRDLHERVGHALGVTARVAEGGLTGAALARAHHHGVAMEVVGGVGLGARAPRQEGKCRGTERARARVGRVSSFHGWTTRGGPETGSTA